MNQKVKAGSILIEEGTHLPGGELLQREAHSSGWSSVNTSAASFDNELLNAGWTYFYMAREIRSRVFGFNRQKRLRTALSRLIRKVKSQNCNSIQITRVREKSIFSVPYVIVSAHARHLQQGLIFSGKSAT